MNNESLGEALPKEIARVRDELLPLYDSVGPPGAFAAAMMRVTLKQADKAMIEGDLPAMLVAYRQLKDYE